MANNEIGDDQITASSQWPPLAFQWRDGHYYFGPRNGRLNFTSTSTRTGAWSSEKNDHNQWLQVDFLRPTIIIGISTQGRHDVNQHVKNYTISYGDDGKNFYSYLAGGILKVR